MMEHSPQVKRDEQYPLLKVESGGGDTVTRTNIPPKTDSSAWHVTCTPKQSWCSRWPELISACWMTVILLAISFLIFYALGMSAYRRQPVVIVRCNESKPASDVYYHHIVPRDAYVPFSLFSEYISYMAKQYPFLHFNVYFLIDDSWQNSIQGPRHLRFLKRLVPQITAPYSTIFGPNHKREIKDFQRRYENVNISVMYLSKYMAMTPMRYKWRIIPPNYLSFYARIYAIWQNGGIGFDLVTFNNQFNQNRMIDHRLDAILKQHNEGIKSEKYADAFNSLDNQEQNQEQNEIFAMFFNMINQILNETSSFFGADSPDIKVINNTPVTRTHRSKRDVTANDTDTSSNTEVNNQTSNDNSTVTNNTSEKTDLYKMNISKEINSTNEWNAFDGIKKLIEAPEIIDPFNIQNISNFNVDMPQVVFFYDISAEDIGPSYSSFKNHALKCTTRMQSKSKYLSLTPEGHFVAASSRHHPFLAQLFSSGCQRFSPQFAIKDTLLSQCSGFLRDDIYCENIRVIYNVV